jgi:hypothetical protein
VRLLLVLIPLLLVGCGGGSPGSEGGGTIFGIVSGGPGGACPSQEGPCSVPASGLTLSFSREGSQPITTTTNATGHYRVNLPAGRYTVEGPKPLKPMHVEVSAGESRRVDFASDTKVS